MIASDLMVGDALRDMYLRDTETPAVRSVLVDGAVVVTVSGVAVVGAAQTNYVAPILAFAGATIVALVAAITAQRRQAGALLAERERLADQLNHERRLSDLAHVRVLLDEAAEAYESGLKACATVSSRAENIYRAQQSRDARDPSVDVDDRQWLNELLIEWGMQVDRASDAQANIAFMWRRLLIRFDHEEPLILAYDKMRDAYRRLVDLADMPELEADCWDRMDELLHEGIDSFWEFCAAARKLIGPVGLLDGPIGTTVGS